MTARPVRRPRFSVVLAACDHAASVEASIASVLSQTLEDLELLAIVAGSADGTLSIAQHAASGDPRAVVVTREESGLVAARNAGIAIARGELVAFLDPGDLYLPGFLGFMASRVSLFPGRALWVCSGVDVDAAGRHAPLSPTLPRDTTRELSLADVAWAAIRPCAVVMDAERLRGLGGLRDVAEPDYDLWLRAMAACGEAMYFPERLVERHAHERVEEPEPHAAALASETATLREIIATLPPAPPGGRSPSRHDDRAALEKRLHLLERRATRISARGSAGLLAPIADWFDGLRLRG